MKKTNAVLVGTGGMAGYHLTTMLLTAKTAKTTRFTALVEPSEQAREATRAVFAKHKIPCPPFFDSIKDFLKNGPQADAAFLITPHKYHLKNASECLMGGLDVLLEKPMVLNAAEARALIRARDKSGRLLVVAFPGHAESEEASR